MKYNHKLMSGKRFQSTILSYRYYKWTVSGKFSTLTANITNPLKYKDVLQETKTL